MSQDHSESSLFRLPGMGTSAVTSAATSPGESRQTTPLSPPSTTLTSVSSSPGSIADDKLTQPRCPSQQSLDRDASSTVGCEQVIYQPAPRSHSTVPSILLSQDAAVASIDTDGLDLQRAEQFSTTPPSTTEDLPVSRQDVPSPPLLIQREFPSVAPESISLPSSRQTTPGSEDTDPLPFPRLGSPNTDSDQSRSGSPESSSSESTSSESGASDASSPASRSATPVPIQPHYDNPFQQKPSKAAEEWEHRTREYGETNDAIDELMRLEGLEEVKNQFLDIKSKVDLCKEQGRDLKHERFNIVFQGNPGTGKTTIARLYAKFLHSIGVVGSEHVEETSGISICADGLAGAVRMIENILDDEDGGVLFVDEAYQLTAPYTDGIGRQILDTILTAMERHIGKLAVIFVGYKDEMESFYEHNPGLSSRIPYSMNFADFTDAELWKILYDNIHTQYKGKMKVEDDMNGLYMRVAIRRLAQARGSRSFGNARAVQNLLAKISHRQARRITRERREGQTPDPLLFTKEDMIGPAPSRAAEQSPAWTELQKLIGLESVKECVRSMLRMTQANYTRELAELKPLRFSLNQLFVGAPGTGKTTVAKLYGQILTDIGLLSRGDVILKTPADFIGQCLGKSEAKTKKILEATVGKVLVIDEAYMLDAGEAGKEQDKFRTGVIDTLVAMVQGVPGEDRCIILVGYEDKISDMFHNVNPGLSRRFPIARPFRFENFDLPQLKLIMQKKMAEQDLEATPRALETASDVLQRALMRPNFANAGEVDSVLDAAKMRYERRQSSLPVEEQVFDGQLEPEDFDEDHARGSSPAGTDSRRELEGFVHEAIIEKLASYQTRCLAARRQGLSPRDQVRTNFVFKGFPGTGKTTVAQHMGKVFYNMGFLATPDVIERSATDLLGQYVGQTCPKTRKVLEKALGKVLVIDEAYRLVHGQYAAEAVEELIQFLNKPSHAGRMVVILVGYKMDMHLLMTMWPVLSGLFTEEIVFENLRPEECITLLLRELEESQIVTQNSFLLDSSNADYAKVKRLFGALQVTPSWGNARDVKYLAKQILGKFLESSGPAVQTIRMVTVNQVLQCLMELISQRRDRALNPMANSDAALPAQPPISVDFPPTLATHELAPPPPLTHTSVHAAGATSTVTRNNDTAGHKQSQTQAQLHSHQDPLGPANPAICVRTDGLATHRSPREAGVSDAEWARHQTEKEQALQEQKQREIRGKQLEKELATAEAALASGVGGNTNRLKARCDILRDEQNALREMRVKEEKIQQVLQAMNRCVNGYAWNHVAGGWRCDGGMHFVSDQEIKANLYVSKA